MTLSSSVSALKHRQVSFVIRDMLLDYSGILLAHLVFGYFRNLPTLMIAILVTGVFIYRLQIIAHDGLHVALHKNRKINDFITRYLLLAPQCTPMSLNRFNHLNHHTQFSRIADKDWQYYQVSDKNTRWKFYGWLFQVLSFGFVFKIAFKLLGIGQATPAQTAARTPDKTQLQADWLSIVLMQLLILAVYAMTLGWTYYFLIWLLSVFGVMVPLNTLRSFAEHSIMEVDGSHSNRLFTFTSNQLEAFILAPHNMNYHFEHHAYMHIPYYNLPALQKILQKHHDYSLHTRASYLGHIRQFFQALPIL